jgi:parvulin-like peptidyl-prolyl isomerase
MDNNTIEPESLKVQKPEEKIEPKEKIENKPKKMSVKTAIIILVIIVILALAYFYKGLFIAATINGTPISRLTIIQKLEKAYGSSTLDSLIVEKLIENEAKAKGIAVSDDEVNAEIKKVEDQISAQGSTLGAELSAQGMSMDDFKNQIIFRMKVEKLLGDKINVTDEEVEQYIKDNKVTIPSGQEAVARDQIKSSLSDQKLNTEAPTLISGLKSKASIQYFVNY